MNLPVTSFLFAWAPPYPGRTFSSHRQIHWTSIFNSLEHVNFEKLLFNCKFSWYSRNDPVVSFSLFSMPDPLYSNFVELSTNFLCGRVDSQRGASVWYEKLWKTIQRMYFFTLEKKKTVNAKLLVRHRYSPTKWGICYSKLQNKMAPHGRLR